MAVGKIILTLKSEVDSDDAINRIGKVIIELGMNLRGITLLTPSIDDIYINYIQGGQAQ